MWAKLVSLVGYYANRLKMSGTHTDQQHQHDRPRSLKRMFLVVCGVTCGVALAAVLVAGLVVWYTSRPKPPAPWDTKAVTAKFGQIDTEGEQNTFVFAYVLQNNTQTDYTLDDSSPHHLLAHLLKENSLSLSGDLLRPELPVFLPAGHRSWFRIHLNYPSSEASRPSATQDERRAYREKLKAQVHSKLSNLDGFVLFDESRRYEISLPKGW